MEGKVEDTLICVNGRSYDFSYLRSKLCKYYLSYNEGCCDCPITSDFGRPSCSDCDDYAKEAIASWIKCHPTMLKGHWIQTTKKHIFHCSECGTTMPYIVEDDRIIYWESSFCGHCGAEMFPITDDFKK